MRISPARVVMIFPLLAAACGGPPAPPAAPVVTVPPSAPGAQEPPAAPARPMATAEPPKAPPGLTFDDPIEACGPRQSYKKVANYRCEDGSMPLAGNTVAGRDARLGSSKSHMPGPPGDFANSHIVDIYRVPCPNGPVTLYVCMYHCKDKSTPSSGTAAASPLSGDSM